MRQGCWFRLTLQAKFENHVQAQIGSHHEMFGVIGFTDTESIALWKWIDDVVLNEWQSYLEGLGYSATSEFPRRVSRWLWAQPAQEWRLTRKCGVRNQVALVGRAGAREVSATPVA